MDNFIDAVQCNLLGARKKNKISVADNLYKQRIIQVTEETIDIMERHEKLVEEMTSLGFFKVDNVTENMLVHLKTKLKILKSS